MVKMLHVYVKKPCVSYVLLNNWETNIFIVGLSYNKADLDMMKQQLD